jgi:hypothetical protein
MLKVCFCAKQVDGLTASRQILTSKTDSIKSRIDELRNFRVISKFYNEMYVGGQTSKT